jgi:hypothetical protein
MDFTAFSAHGGGTNAVAEQADRVFISWLDAQGWPVAAVQSFVWDRGAFWTTFRDRPRVSLLLDEPRSAVTVSSAGPSLDPN